MNTIQTKDDAKTAGSKLLRTLVSSNLLLLVALIGPLNSRRIYDALKASGFDDAVVVSIQGWILASTVVATGLFVRAYLRKSNGAPVEGKLRPIISDGKLLLFWWIILAAVCLYALMLGLSGF
ncbi:MAG TPA: hypothetical protein VG206_19560 [Terriglobia bacterium]|nr:hypothetical protein [Terriglobia bacterium]